MLAIRRGDKGRAGADRAGGIAAACCGLELAEAGAPRTASRGDGLSDRGVDPQRARALVSPGEERWAEGGRLQSTMTRDCQGRRS